MRVQDVAEPCTSIPAFFVFVMQCDGAKDAVDVSDSGSEITERGLFVASVVEVEVAVVVI